VFETLRYKQLYRRNRNWAVLDIVIDIFGFSYAEPTSCVWHVVNVFQINLKRISTMEQDLGKAFSAMRLAEAKNSRTTLSQKYQNSSSKTPSYGYKSVTPEVKYNISYDCTESVYANLQELSGEHGVRGKVRYPDPYIPPPKEFSQNVAQVSHIPTQSKVSLEEAMRYTPPNLMNPTTETPVYENIQLYTTSPQTSPTPGYLPVSSNVSQSKPTAYYTTQQPLKPVYFPQQQTSLKCNSYLPVQTSTAINQAPQQQKNIPRFSQPAPSYPAASLQPAGNYDKSPQYKQRFAQTSPTPIPLAAIPSRKVLILSSAIVL